ncbi:WG repeat-containing protein [Chitinophaga tropicalis]|nr:WG repeat-containing protein [Chitinophaga tropicalis]
MKKRLLGGLLFLTLHTHAQTKLERWYPGFTGLRATKPVFFDKTGQVKLSFDSSFTLLEGALGENVFYGEYMVLEKKQAKETDTLYYITDRKGNLKGVPPGIRFLEITANRIIAQKDRKFGLIRMDLSCLTPFKYSFIRPFSEGLAVAEADAFFTLLDTAGHETIPFDHRMSSMGNDSRYDVKAYQNNVSEGYSNYSENGLLGIMDKNGKTITPARFDYLYQFCNGRAYASRKDSSGYVNTRGEFVIGPAPKDKYYGNFSGGLVRMKNNDGTYCYIDTTGKVVLPGKLLGAGDFNHGYAVVTIEGRPAGKKQIIDTKGKVIYEGEFENAWFMEDVVVITYESRFAGFDVTSNNYSYLDYNFHTVWQPPCSAKIINRLPVLNACDYKEVKVAYLGSYERRFTLSELMPFLKKANPEELHLQVTDKNFKLPSSITKMKNLKELQVSFCELSEIPEDIGNLTSLEELDFDYTSIRHIPKSMYKLKNLKKISLKSTQLPLDEIITLKKEMPGVKVVFKDNQPILIQ